MRTVTSLVCVLTLSLVGCQPAAETTGLEVSDIFDGRAGTWVDLTYSFAHDTIYWPTGSPFELEETFFGMNEKGYFYSSYDFSASEHGGTHFDAPIHFAEGAPAADEVSIDRLIGPAVVVDVTQSATPDYQIGIADLEGWEQRHGPIPDRAIVLFRTGWGSRWPDPKRFLGTDRTGPEAVPELHFPGISPQAARWLVDERRIDAIGIDTPSIDYGQSELFESHQILYTAEIPGFENVANLERLPENGSYVIALPMKIAGGSGGPLRIVAFIPT
jgi:kynurenine formamidase